MTPISREESRPVGYAADWFGIVAGVCWGLALSRFFAADDMTGPWLVILFGPPLVLLISSTRPILSWQLPIVIAVVAAAFMNRTSDDSAGGAWAEAALLWFICSLLSLPWALIFRYRARHVRQPERAPWMALAYIGIVLLVFACCAMTLLGIAATVYSTDASDAQNQPFPIYGFLAATAGIVLSFVTERTARRLEIQRPVRGVFELLMIPGVLVGIAEIVDLFFWPKPSGSSLHYGVFGGILVGMEALAAMIWLTRADRREQNDAVQAESMGPGRSL